jgi:polyisoprenyl-phosphate glycosyltransferase
VLGPQIEDEKTFAVKPLIGENVVETIKEESAPDKEISIVVPVFNEENNIEPFLDRIEPVLEKLGVSYEILFILDPSDDNTEKIILENIERNSCISLIIMTRRWGQNSCLAAGMENCQGKVCITIDVDLQDPPELIGKMYEKSLEGYDVVLTKRKSRKGESRIRLLITHVGYWVIQKISDVPIPMNAGDFRLLNRQVIDRLIKLKEKHGFLRGLIPFLGYNQTIISFDRDERTLGKTKYNPFFGSIKHGWDGIVAFSIIPLSAMITLGVIFLIFASLIGLFLLVKGIVLGQNVLIGNGPILLLFAFWSGIQLVCMGIMGQYIGRIYEEVRDRPRYIIKKRIN